MSARRLAHAFTSCDQRGVGADRARELDAARVQIHTDHGAARGPGHLHDEQPDQPEPDHRDRLPQLGLREAEPVEADRAHGRERRVLELHPGRHRCGQVDRHAHDLCMRCVPASRARHPVAHPEGVHPLAHGDHHARGQVARSPRLVEPGAGCLPGGQRAIRARLVEHPSHQIGPRARLREQTLFRELEARALGAGGHERRGRPHEHHARGRLGRGHLHHGGSAGRGRLEELFHRSRKARCQSSRVRSCQS